MRKNRPILFLLDKALRVIAIIIVLVGLFFASFIHSLNAIVLLNNGMEANWADNSEQFVRMNQLLIHDGRMCV